MAVRVDHEGAVTTIVIDLPEARNAVDRKTADELSRAFTDFENDPEASVVVLCGEGETFCAGADLKAFAAGEGANRVEPDGDGPMGPTRRILNKPAIAAIEGYALSGGLELALFCDLRVAAEDATLGVFCRRFGVPLIDGGTVRLPRLIGLSRALDLILTGRAVDAQEALTIGLINRVVRKGTARAAAEELAKALADLPQECLRNDRLSTYEQAETADFAQALQNEFRRGQLSLEEARDGARSFAEGHGRHGQIINKPGSK